MTLRQALLACFIGLTAACVSTGHVDPLKTEKGRNAARDAYVQLGLGYLQQGNTEAAKTPLKNALDIDPDNADAHAALALVFQAQMEPALADQHYRKALASRPGDARILNNYGSFLFEQKDYEKALQRFHEAAEDTLYAERSRVFLNMGMTALALGRKEEAREYLQRALRLDSRQPQALLEMAKLSYEAREYVPARNYYVGFLNLSEQNAASLLLGIQLATVFEDRDTAASYALQLKRLYPASREYQAYLSEHR